MDTLYVQMTNPVMFLGDELPKIFHRRVNPQAPALDQSFSPDLYYKFLSMYGSLTISAGLPHGDYGQTVSLQSPIDIRAPNIEELVWLDIPAHLMSENLPLSPSEMSGRYARRNEVNTKGPDRNRVTEKYFFEYTPGYVPTTFSKLRSSLGGLRYLSDIMHALETFEVVMMPRGTYVRISTRYDKSSKPEFFMGS